MSGCYVPGTVLGAENTVVNKTGRSLCSWWEETLNRQIDNDEKDVSISVMKIKQSHIIKSNCGRQGGGGRLF